jgi:uncharacterized protein with beta-barrel porin domain
MTKMAVTASPVNARLTGSFESLTASVTSGPSPARTAACGGAPSAARPDDKVAAVTARFGGLRYGAEQQVGAWSAAVSHGDERAVPGDNPLTGEWDTAGDVHTCLIVDRNRGK